MYVETPKGTTKAKNSNDTKLSELMRDFSQVQRHKVDEEQPIVFLCTSNKQLEIENLKTITITVASKIQNA